MVNKALYFRDRISFCLQAKIIRFTQLGPIGPEVESNFAYMHRFKHVYNIMLIFPDCVTYNSTET
jgi:hypothetical protein